MIQSTSSAKRNRKEHTSHTTLPGNEKISSSSWHPFRDIHPCRCTAGSRRLRTGTAAGACRGPSTDPGRIMHIHATASRAALPHKDDKVELYERACAGEAVSAVDSDGSAGRRGAAGGLCDGPGPMARIRRGRLRRRDDVLGRKDVLWSAGKKRSWWLKYSAVS